MKRREFVTWTAGLIGASSLPILARGEPCPPPHFQVDGGTAVDTSCEPPKTPAWLQGKPVDQWIQLQSLSAAGVAPNPLPPGIVGVRSVVDKWSGAAVRANGSHYIIHGGGHGDYAGNEIYTLQLSSDSPTWTRRWGPSPNSAIVTKSAYYTDGNPASMHTYYCLWFDNQMDILRRVQGGSYSEPSGNNGKFSSWKWNAGSWNPAGTHPDIPFSYVNAGAGTVMHPTTGDIYYWDARSRAIWSRASNKWTFSTTNTPHSNYGGLLLLDAARKCVWCVGGIAAETQSGQVYKWDLSSNAVSSHSVSGASEITLGTGMGGDFCPANGLFYIFHSGSVYTFNAATMTIAKKSISGTGPQASYPDNNGVWGKFKYVPELAGFVVTPAWSAPTFFFRVKA